ncbi:daunorubicin resistance protein DrrA family ABC transporter ATP-binding protein [Secundilactobacillus similis DSM 23365 = JCM 2765]|uniref:Aunorubicin resistance ABC superfamily ATP binding cassette transporter efflux permease n=1 Tax=Secundilactobacillus similis DSM 23365 = JCM 2765 TaxID=1423804 RepID=A0A0R2FHD3_9LACO|nr:ABC transporter ATP-binding protein [Secundilactobacillus similis]KRN25509.1 aunorubicin resistance ABC superfamily ATP binding cassette transporter efflux permease [Secundilactobacillus similis DSM 23365 = JCM 2765]
MIAIDVTDVKKRFGKLEVLKGITLQAQQGEIFTLLGENGAGKSTLINILTTLSQADAGTVSIMGLDLVKNGNQVRQQMTLNAQSMTVDEDFTGLDNLRLIATLRNVQDVPAAIEAVATQLDLTTFLKRKVKIYSGGMKRRLDIAMSLLGNPQIVFLDEPTTGVDPKNRLALWQLIREMRDAGKTVFLTTQYLDEADALSDHIAFIRDGRIVKSGTPAEIKQRVTESYTLTVTPSQRAEAATALTAAKIAYTEQTGSFKLTASLAPVALSLLMDQHLTVQQYDLDEISLEDVFLNVTDTEATHAIN